MSQSSPSLAVSRANTLKAIFLGGLLGGTGDLTFAFVYYGAHGMSMQRVMQSVAGGLLGKATFDGGPATAAVGVALHYFIACGAAAVFFAVSRRQPALIKHAVLSGLIFGAAVYFFMNMVVLPLSAYHSRAFPLALPLWPILGHLFLVGLPIALTVRYYVRKSSGNA